MHWQVSRDHRNVPGAKYNKNFPRKELGQKIKKDKAAVVRELSARDLDEIPDEEFPGHKYEVEEKLLVQEAKLSCMKAMLLCLDREQRLVFILGELFEFPDSVGSEVMEISKENFRIKLHRREAAAL